ncbi:MAG: hypothetical protein ACJA2W_000440 [Planctomycetota bacterium]|jgi:hypothetical protein
MDDPIACEADDNETPTPTVTTTVDLAGWLGTILIVGAYGLLSGEVISNGAVYQAMNLVGAAGVALLCWHKRTWQPLVLQLVWMVIAVAALLT